MNRQRYGLFAWSILLLAVRLFASRTVGYGDSEALYASYALHPAPAFLDHPGLIGLFAQTIGNGSAPAASTAHFVTALMATLFPWMIFAAARTMGASSDGCLVAALAVAVTPEISVGLFAMTPDLLLAFTWVFALGIAARALTEKPSSAAAAASFVGAGLIAGVGACAKVSGLLLLAALAWTYASRAARAHAKTIWPWAGLVIGAVAFVPVVLFEARTGWPMLHHRLVETQAGSGPSLANVGKVLGGQLLYVSPLLAVLAAVAFVDLVRHRHDDVLAGLLFRSAALPLAFLVPFCLWSRVAEPHWLAPPLLALPLHFARRYEDAGQDGALFRKFPRFSAAAVGLGALLTVGAHAWVLVPNATRLLPAKSDPKYDISNELYGWSDATRAIREIVGEESMRGEIVAAGPHWVICAQMHAALGPQVRVGCATPIRDDFDTWEPRARWQSADKVLFVTDNRFDPDLRAILPNHSVARRSRVTVLRDGRIARTFIVTLLESRARS
ncbi:ArnT family glycosyltransferase [Pendulispora albinea]|uniref:Glycosyltransferase family 39 protein n=1 Tax=Pendulispora albinea TaxID=2741071 RepID=A0ABZ2MBT0_9BACT